MKEPVEIWVDAKFNWNEAYIISPLTLSENKKKKTFNWNSNKRRMVCLDKRLQKTKPLLWQSEAFCEQSSLLFSNFDRLISPEWIRVVNSLPPQWGIIVGKFAVKNIWLGVGLDLDTLFDILWLFSRCDAWKSRPGSFHPGGPGLLLRHPRNPRSFEIFFK